MPLIGRSITAEYAQAASAPGHRFRRSTSRAVTATSPMAGSRNFGASGSRRTGSWYIGESRTGQTHVAG